MNTIKAENINVLHKNYWTSLCTEKTEEQKEKPESIRNATALIITALNEIFPELKNCSEKQFLQFQDEVSKIIKRFN